jgi:glycosyltransferase involved in cell wall biosynthesis
MTGSGGDDYVEPAGERAGILQVIETGGAGGAETVLLEVARHLSLRGYRVVAGVGRRAWLAERLEAAGVPVNVLRRGRRLDWRLVGQIIGVIRRERVNLVHAHLFTMNLNACVAARLARVPFIATYHGLGDLQGARRRLVNRVIGRLASRVVAVSDFLRGELVNACGVAASRVVTIHNGIALDQFLSDNGPQRRAIREELGVADAWVVGAVGGLRAVKGHLFLVEAVARLAESAPDACLLLVGEGPLRGQLEARAADLGIAGRVRFMGFRDDVPRILAALDCFALPSLSEGLSVATIEAMAAGLPVVVTASGGPSDLVRHGETGLMVPPGDASALSAAIAAIRGDPDLARRLGAAARRKAEAFDVRSMLQKYERLYREVLSDSGCS